MSWQYSGTQGTALELLELFLGSCCFGDLQYVEPHGLAEGSALSDSNNVTHGHVPARNGQRKRKKV